MKSLRDTLHQPTFGAWTSGDSLVCETMSRGGYDWLILETQHRATSPERLLSALQAAELGGTPTLVRIGGVDPVEIGRVLDIGAAGVVVPVVNTLEQARLATRAVRYPPDGDRSFGAVRSPARPDGEKNPICVLMIETVEGLRNLDAIAATPGVDVLFVGLHDLALSMGVDPAMSLPPPIMAALQDVVAACNRHGVTPGCASFGWDNIKRLLPIGMRFLSVAADGAHLRRGIEDDRRVITDLRNGGEIAAVSAGSLY